MNFKRIESTIDVGIMQGSTATVVGGAFGLVCDLVRSGLGEVRTVDFDVVDETNPARQDFYADDEGHRKVDAVSATLQRINPAVKVKVVPRDFCGLARDEMDELLEGTHLLIMATDSFAAQARGNVEAVRLGIPTMWIGLYAGGRAGEIIFHLPGITRACFRCIARSRYEAGPSQQTDVSSDGGTVLDLRLVDAVAAQIAAGIITRGADNRMGKLILKLGNRNLLQVKIDPDYRLGGKDIFGEYLGNSSANFSFTTIALEMEQEYDCPDCGGR